MNSCVRFVFIKDVKGSPNKVTVVTLWSQVFLADYSLVCGVARRVRIAGSSRVRIRHSGRYRAGIVAAAHRTHISGRDAGDASAGGDAQLRGTGAAGQLNRGAGAFRLHREKLAVSIAGNTNAHPGHVIGDVEGVLALAGLEGAVAGGFELV